MKTNFANLALGVIVAVLLWIWLPTALKALPSGPGRCHPPTKTPVEGDATLLQVDSLASDDNNAQQLLQMTLGRGGKEQTRSVPRLQVSGGAIAHDVSVLNMTATDFVRDDGATLSSDQVATWAGVAQSRTTISVYVCVDPRAGQVAEAGRYQGSVYLDDPRASGGVVPVSVVIPYPQLERVFIAALAGALGGLIWAWVIRRNDGRIPTRASSGGTLDNDPIMESFAVRVAAMLTAVPVVVALVLNAPDSKGGMPQFVALITAAGAAVIAAVPTFRAIGHENPAKTDTEPPGSA